MSDLLIWPVAIPVIASLLTLLSGRWGNAIGILASIGTLTVAAIVAAEVFRNGALTLALGGWAPGLGIALRGDALSAALLLMCGCVALAISIYASAYFEAAQKRAHFWPVWMLLLAALNALLLSGDIFNLYVTLELVGLTAVTLGALGGTREAVVAALRYLTVGLIGSMAFLTGVVLLYAAYGTLDLAALSAAIEDGPATWVSLTLITLGLLLKSALFPLHFWLPPAHANAPAPVSAALSALVVKAAFYLLMRLWLDVFFHAINPAAGWLLGLLGAAAVLWGSWQAVRAERLKVLAAYSTVAQMGYLFLFIPLLIALPTQEARETAFGALVLFALTHGFAKSALFLSAGVIQQQAGHDRIADLGGTARALPVTTFVLALAGVALIGLPPSGTFLAKWQLLATAIELGVWPWVPVVAAGSLLAGAYMFRVLGHAFAPGDREGAALAGGRVEVPELVLAIIATVILGLAAGGLWDFLARAPLGMAGAP
jgi:formate hydrogenlyase subunit 3/multisubunit Na+/H+ antiporter MnhD subunit